MYYGYRNCYFMANPKNSIDETEIDDDGESGGDTEHRNTNEEDDLDED